MTLKLRKIAVLKTFFGKTFWLYNPQLFNCEEGGNIVKEEYCAAAEEGVV